MLYKCSCLLLTMLVAAQAGPPALDKTLLAIERQFFEGWKNKQMAPFEENIAPEGVAWGEYGPLDRSSFLAVQRGAESRCEVRSFELRDARVTPITADVALLVYTADQDASCGGGPVPTPVACSSVYVRRGGRWLNIYRAGVPLKTLPT